MAKKNTPKAKNDQQKESISPREEAVKKAFAAGLAAGRELEADELDDSELEGIDAEDEDDE